MYEYRENNEVVRTFAALPRSWKNISNLPALPKETLEEFGFFWVEPEPQELAPEEPEGPAIVVEVTMRQARLALLQGNLLHLVDPAIDALPEPDRSAARIEWEYSQTVERNKPFVQMLGAALGLSEQQIDQLFETAATL